MPYLNELPGILRAAGLTVEVDSGFTTNNHGIMSTIQSIMCHHTAGPKTGDRPSFNVVKNGRAGLPGPLSQLFLARSGVWVCVSNGQAWHAGAVSESRYNNQHSIGIEAEATGLDAWPADQYWSYARGCNALANYYRCVITSHKEACSPKGRKPDPNFDMNKFRADAATSGGQKPPVVIPKEQDEPVVTNYDVPAGNGGRRFIQPTGPGGSQIVAKAWISMALNGPRDGKLSVWFQTDTSGISDYSSGIGFNEGRSGRVWWEVPAGTTQIATQWEAPDGGTICIETKPYV